MTGYLNMQLDPNQDEMVPHLSVSRAAMVATRTSRTQEGTVRWRATDSQVLHVTQLVSAPADVGLPDSLHSGFTLVFCRSQGWIRGQEGPHGESSLSGR